MAMDAGSKKRLEKAHPLLQKLFNEVAKVGDIQVLDSMRGEAAQTLAYKSGRSKVKFGQSAHNYNPAIALDVVPLPLNWKNWKAFEALSKVVLAKAKELKIPIRWGADWNMNGKTSDERFIDGPHYELHPWRKWAKESKLFKG